MSSTNQILISDEALAAILAREQKASAGPWRAVAYVGTEPRHVATGAFTEQCPIASADNPNGLVAYADLPTNAEFIAHARTDIPALVDSVKALKLEVHHCQQAFELDAALKLSEVGDLNALQIIKKMVNLQSQLAALKDWKESWTEVTKAQFIEAEQAAGFKSKFGANHVVMGGFTGRGMCGRVEYVGAYKIVVDNVTLLLYIAATGGDDGDNVEETS